MAAAQLDPPPAFGVGDAAFREGDPARAPVIWTLRFLEALHLSPLYKWVYETAATDSFVSIEKAERVLGYKPKYSVTSHRIRTDVGNMWALNREKVEDVILKAGGKIDIN